MALNLIKLCVGCDSIQELEGWIKQRMKDKRKRGEKPEHIHRTRMTPKRTAELTDGGSLYWVIRGEIACRQRIRELRPYRDKDGIGRCGIVLPGLALPHRQGRAAGPGQGWAWDGCRDAGEAAARAARPRPHVRRAGPQGVTRIALPGAIT
jgi:hypothetical protein